MEEDEITFSKSDGENIYNINIKPIEFNVEENFKGTFANVYEKKKTIEEEKIINKNKSLHFMDQQEFDVFLENKKNKSQEKNSAQKLYF